VKESLKALLLFANNMAYRFLNLRITKTPPFGGETYMTDLVAHEILMSACKRTMTSENSLFNLVEAVRYVELNKIEGDIVECGVWRGGSIIAILKTLLSINSTSREIYLYDTFEGMTDPQNIDRSMMGKFASDLMARKSTKIDRGHEAGVVAYASISDVQSGILEIAYPVDKVHLIVGDVTETLRVHKHRKIAILRLDTDWYLSTKSELVHLWDLVSPGGIVIIDDYDYWQGSRKAVDEFFAERNIQLFKMKMASGGRIIVKN